MDRARRLLRDVYGYSGFRAGQEAVVQTAFEGRDALVLMPTGGGKSLCYQLPAMAAEGVGIVVSPLIALMQ
ncbi:MAG: DEAD/DEAH box helicase, partial [Gammaproteobacteria bacterium]|nr:DEAD/DEAH box helicase [Gammaproteobacteria bacterium]